MHPEQLGRGVFRRVASTGYGWDVVVIVSGVNRNGQDATARPPTYHLATYEPK
jgi:hypothetical protein